MITTTSKLRKIIKRIILESVGRNLQSVSNDPISYDVANDFDIDIYYNTDSGKWACIIQKDGRDVVGEKYFNSEDEATHYARSVVEKYKFRD